MSETDTKTMETETEEPLVQAGQTEEIEKVVLPHDHELVEQHDSVAALKLEVEELKHKNEQLSNQVLRAHAELQNLQRARERDVTQAHRYALERFLGALLPVVDGLESAVAINKEATNPFSHGVSLTLKMLLETLKKFGVEPLDPIGAIFDPNFHEAMTMQEDNTVSENTVLTVFQKGYLLNGRLLRPARVVVSKKTGGSS